MELNLSNCIASDIASNLISSDMHGSQCCTILVLLLLASTMGHLVFAAEETADYTLEARDVQGLFNIDESTTISWRNIITNDYILLDMLNESTYSVYRSAVAMNTSNIGGLTPIMSGIKACDGNDSYSQCSGKNHSVEWQSPAGTQGSFHYGVVTILPNGSVTSTLTIGLSQSTALFEDIHPVWAPLRVSAQFDPSIDSTTISWVNADEVGLQEPTNRTIWVWRHLTAIEGNVWADMDKTIIATLASNATSHVFQHNGDVEEEAYYSVTYRFDTWEDLRFIGSNTMNEPVLEDNVAPVLLGPLDAEFDSTTGITTLSLPSGSVIEEELSVQAWRSSSEISNLGDEDVVLLAELTFNATSYQHQVAAGSNGEFWYAATLRDELGNTIMNLETIHPTAGPVRERTLALLDTIPSGLSTQSLSAGKTTLSWNPVSGVSNASYLVWMSQTGEVDEACLSDVECELINSTEQTALSITTPIGVEREVWYAVTVQGIWADASNVFDNRHIISGQNSLISNISEDANPPDEVVDLKASFNGLERTTTLNWSGTEDDAIYTLWRRSGDWSQATVWNLNEHGWIAISTLPGDIGFLSGSHVITNSRSDLMATYAVSVKDQFGNEDTMLNAGAVVLVAEDMLSPSALVGVIPAGSLNTTEQVWLSNGMSIGFHDVGIGVGTLIIQGGEALSTVDCRLLGDQTSETSNWSPAIQDVMTWGCSIDIQKQLNLEIRVNDSAGNPTYVIISISPSSEQSLSQPSDEENNGPTGDSVSDMTSSQAESENRLLRIAFMSLAVLLFIVVLILLLKNRPPALPVGKPTKKEDAWIEAFIN